MHRRDALLSLLAAPLAWAGMERPVRYYQVYVDGTPEPWQGMKFLPCTMTPEPLAREYYDSYRLFAEMNQGISSQMKGEADGQNQ